MKTKHKAIAALIVVSGAFGAHAAFAQENPRVTKEQARATALQAVPGTVVKEELEKEKGLLIYSFHIRPTGASDSQSKEVNLDANSGKVIAVEADDDLTQNESDGEESDDNEGPEEKD